MRTTVPQSARRRASTVNVGPGERVASLAGGVTLLAKALSRPSKAGLMLALGGSYLVYRGVTGHCHSYDLLGIRRASGDGEAASQSSPGIQVDRSVTIARPRTEVYRFWRNLENLPRFMQSLEEVRFAADRRSHWTAKGPLGRPISWEAQIVDDVENELISWTTVPGPNLKGPWAKVKHSGSVHFADAPGGRGTEVTVSLAYHPLAGSAGAALAKLLGQDPAAQVREDLRRFKQIMEASEAPTNDGQTSARQADAGRRTGEPAQDKDNGDGHGQPRRRDDVMIASEQSFPASDPPAWTTIDEPDAPRSEEK